MARLLLLSDRSFLPVSTYDSIIHSPWPRTNVTPSVMPQSVPSFNAFSLNILCTTLRVLSTLILPAVSVHGCPITTGQYSLGAETRSYSSEAPSKVPGTLLAFGKWMNEWMMLKGRETDVNGKSISCFKQQMSQLLGKQLKNNYKCWPRSWVIMILNKFSTWSRILGRWQSRKHQESVSPPRQ